MADFEAICKKIIDTNGNLSEQDVIGCGFFKENFIRIKNANVKPERLVKNAREALLARGIHYKEVM